MLVKGGPGRILLMSQNLLFCHVHNYDPIESLELKKIEELEFS